MAKGINCALKLMKIRKRYKKTYHSPFHKVPHIQNALVLQTRKIGAKQPNSGQRKCVKVQLSNQKKKLSFVPYCGGIEFIKIHDIVTIQSIGGSKCRAKGDMFGLNTKVIKVNDIPLHQLVKGKKKR